MRGRSESLKRTVLLAAVLIIFLTDASFLLGVRVNTTPSLPMGIYIPSKDSALAEFCPSEPFGSLAAARGYRAQGICPDNAEPLLKPIVARAGDHVQVSECGIAVNGNLLSNTAPRPDDSQGRPLAHWPFGTYTVAPGTAWVASSYDPRSFDSRYFGPVGLDTVRGHLRLLLEF